MKDKRGQPRKDERRKAVIDLRDKNYSYSEIARILYMSKALAWYYANKKLSPV